MRRQANRSQRRVQRRRMGFRATAVLLVLVAVTSSFFGGSRPTPAAGFAAGGALAGFATSALDPCAPAKLAAPRELRGMWLTSVSNSDWPSKPGLPIETVKAEYIAWLDLAVKMNHNAIFVHVRPSGDAFWPSQYAPWSYWLTGRKDGADPGWDPMPFLVSEAHARNLEFHAWFNPYKASQEGTISALPANHPLRAHPDWALTYPATGAGARLYYDPGNPAARVFVEDSILELVKNYDIDGVHFDDFFYPYPSGSEAFPDTVSYAQVGGGQSLADWRRHNVDLFVQETGRRIKEIKPWVRYGISPFGIWRNASTDPLGSKTSGLQSYDAIYADTRKWVTEGWIDYIVPQLYWNIGFAVADYATLLKWWTALTKDTKVQLYIGQADYRVGQTGAWKDPTQLDKQIALNQASGVQGSVHFSASDVRADRLGAVTRYRNARNATPALIPAVGPVQRPGTPTNLVVRGATLSWRPGAGPKPYMYAIYRADQPIGAAELAATIPATDKPMWTDPVTTPPDHYCVTALDRQWNESD
jgi:uncharacterized lipoprotein YddW (UPF0748 family)